MLHHAVNDGVIGFSYARVHIAEHPMAGGVVQRVGVGGAAVAADKFPDNGLGRQLRIIVIHIKCIAAARDGAGDGFGVSCHSGQPHECRQQAHQRQQLGNGFLHNILSPNAKAGSSRCRPSVGYSILSVQHHHDVLVRCCAIAHGAVEPCIGSDGIRTVHGCQILEGGVHIAPYRAV